MTFANAFQEIGGRSRCGPTHNGRRAPLAWLGWLASLACMGAVNAETFVIGPANADADCREPFEAAANALQPGDTLILQHGRYSQSCRRSIRVRGTPARPIVIRAARGARPTLTRPLSDMDRHNNLEIVDSAYLTIRGLRLFGGSIGVRFIGGHDIVFEGNEVSATGASAITLNSGDATRIVLRNNHIHHSGRSQQGRTTGEGIYLGCHDGGCAVTDSLVEGNYIHDLRATAKGGNDGIEVKPGSGGNRIVGNRVHDTLDGRAFPCILVYGAGQRPNVVEFNRVWRCGEGIVAIADALVRYNTVTGSTEAGIVSAPHAAVGAPRNVVIEGNVVRDHPVCLRLHWSRSTGVALLGNTLLCPGATAVDARLGRGAVLRDNVFAGRSSVRSQGLMPAD